MDLIFKNKKAIKTLVAVVFLMFNIFIVPTRVAFAQNCANVNYDDPSIVQIICPFIAFINIAILSAGVVFVGIILVASTKFATAQGDPKAAMGAKATITYAVAGLTAVIGVYVILNLLGNVFGFNKNLTNSGVLGIVQNSICDLLTDPNGWTNAFGASRPILTNPAGCTP